jgi:ribosomal protein S18 acetylase RimI-like enzyme
VPEHEWQRGRAEEAGEAEQPRVAAGAALAARALGHADTSHHLDYAPDYDRVKLTAQPDIRAAEPRDDATVARLLYESASGRYDLFAGGGERAQRLLMATIATPGNDTSREGIVVAELDGEPAGVLASFPTREGDERRRRWLRIAYRRRAPWHWPGMMRVAAAGDAIPYEPPADSLYVDGLTTDARFRRRGVATALLGAADERARALGLRSLALDTAASNTGAQALYEGAGFHVAERIEPSPPIPGIVCYEREVA